MTQLTQEMHNVIKLAAREVVDSLDREPDIDQDARNLANAAIQAIQSHERVCEERDRNATVQRVRVEAKVDENARAMIAMRQQLMTAVIVLLLGMLGFLLGQYYITHL